MKNTKSAVNQIFMIHIFAYLIPLIFVTSYAWLLTWIDEKMMTQLMLSIPNAINSLFFIIVIPLVFRKLLLQTVEDAEQGKDELVRKKIYIGLWLFLLGAFVYGVSSIIFFNLMDFPAEKINFSVIMCVVCNIMIAIPFFVIIINRLDSLFSNVKIIRNRYFISVSNKMRLTNLLPTVLSMYFLVAAIYMLLIQNTTSKGVLTMPIDEIIMRLSIIAVTSVLLIILPMFFLGKQLTKQIMRIEHHTNLIASGDLRQLLERTASDELGLVTQAINAMQNDLQKMMEGIQKASQNIQKVGNIVKNSSGNLAQESQAQVVYTSDMSNSIEQMTMNIEGNSNNAEQCDVLSSEVGKLANQSYDIVVENVKAIQEITQKVKVINEIANQTNLLAINATIEAASAGIHGLGFAVVAKEVRVLAEKSRASAKDINELSFQCLSLVEKTQQTINTLKPKAQTTSDLSEQIFKVSQMTRNEGLQVSDKIHQLNVTAQTNSGISQHLFTQSNQLNQQVQILNRLIDGIKI